jgi:hypothetical protein
MLAIVRPSRGLIAVVALALAFCGAAPAAAARQDGDDVVDPSIADGSAQRALDAARARWRATGLRSYRFRVARRCFCNPAANAPAVIVVRDGRPVDPPRRLRFVATVTRLFRKVQHAIDDRVDGLSVRYGSRRGIPRSISIDFVRMLADEEVSYVVDRFKPL